MNTVELRLPKGDRSYEVHKFEPGKRYVVTFDPMAVNARHLEEVCAGPNARGLDIEFIPAFRQRPIGPQEREEETLP